MPVCSDSALTLKSAAARRAIYTFRPLTSEASSPPSEMNSGHFSHLAGIVQSQFLLVNMTRR